MGKRLPDLGPRRAVVTPREGEGGSMISGHTIEEARAFAAGRYGLDDTHLIEFYDHIRPVANLVSDYGPAVASEEWAVGVAAAWLHDMLEDHLATEEEIAERFPDPVVQVVRALTAPPGTRKERNDRYFHQIASAGRTAILVKVCDRISNVERCWRNRDARLFMYRDEYPAFKGVLQQRFHLLAAWNRLDLLLGVHRQEPMKLPSHDVTR